VPSLRALRDLCVPSNGFTLTKIAQAICECLAVKQGYSCELESLNIGNNHWSPADLLAICKAALSLGNLPKLKKLVIAFSNFGEKSPAVVQIAGAAAVDASQEYIGDELCRLLHASEQRLEVLDVRCCNLSLNDMKVLQEAIKKNTRLNLKEINAGLNKFNKTDLKSLLQSKLGGADGSESTTSAVTAEDERTDIATSGPSTRKNSVSGGSGLQSDDPLHLVDILAGPDGQQADFFTYELSQCLKLY